MLYIEQLHDTPTILSMGTLNAVYFEHIDGVDYSAFNPESVEQNETWIGLILARDEFQVADATLMELSKQCGDVIFMSFQSVVDAFQYTHVVDGTIVRKLVYGCYVAEREWETVEGEEADWEEDVFIESEYDEDEGEEFEASIEPTVGTDRPSIDARNVCLEIASHFGFPGFE